MMFLRKNKVLFLILSFVVLSLFISNSALAADPIGCCRYDQNDGGTDGWEPYATNITKAECLKKDNPKGNPPTDMMLWRQDAYAEKGQLGSRKGEYAWCKYNDASKNTSGCCEWKYAPKLGDLPQAWDMTELACHSLKGYEVSTVAWYKGGTAEDEKNCKKGTSPIVAGNPNSNTPSSPMVVGNPVSMSGNFSNLDNPLGTYSIPELIGRVIRAILGIVGSLALIMFVVGGLLWMTSMGNEKRIAAGKSTLVWAAVGLVVVFFSYVIVRFVLETVVTP